MLPNIDQVLYAKFKVEGYGLKIYKEDPVTTIPEIVDLGYLDVRRNLHHIDSEQRCSFKQVVVSFIEGLLARPPANQTEFDQSHHECCQQCLVCSSPRGPACIHYGHAQKLLNMSLKYLYNEYAVYKGKHNHFGFPDNNIESFFHLPIDCQTRNRLVRSCYFKDPTRLPWSKWSYEHYISFQHQLRKRISAQYRPLEIDYMVWNTEEPSLENAIAPI